MTTVSKSGFLPAHAQYQHWGISAELKDEQVHVRMGSEATSLTPGEVRSFALHLLRAGYRAEIIDMARRARS